MMKLMLGAAALAAALLPGACIAATPTGIAAAPAFAPTRFTVTVEGEGPDVILIPGLASPREVWDGARAALGGRYRLHLVELNGFGGSEAGANAEGGILPGTVAELSRYIAANRLGRPAIVGHSMGGLIGLMIAKDHPEQVGRLMIVDSLPWIGLLFGPGATVETVGPRAAALRDMMRSLPRHAPGAPAAAPPGMSRTPEGRAQVGRWSAEADPAVVGQAMYETTVSDLRSALPAIRVPITMLYPWDEGTVGEAQARALYEQAYRPAPDARPVAVAHSQHFIMLDQPARFEELLREFLGGTQ